jgi:hypothetical protein
MPGGLFGKIAGRFECQGGLRVGSDTECIGPATESVQSFFRADKGNSVAMHRGLVIARRISILQSPDFIGVPVTLPPAWHLLYRNSPLPLLSKNMALIAFNTGHACQTVTRHLLASSGMLTSPQF